MEITVIKRDGRKVIYDKDKIRNAVTKAFGEVYEQNDHDKATIDLITENVHKEILANLVMSDSKEIGIEDIQNIVENVLMSEDKVVAKKYIIYRNERNKYRKSKLYRVFDSISNVESNDITKENANMNPSTPSGMMMKFASESTKAYTDDCKLSREAEEAVDENYIHIHDKDYYPTKSLTCLQHPLDKILKNGFRAGHGSDRAAKHIESAGAIACISMETVQNEMHGGQAIPAFDFYLAPYVRLAFKEELDYLAEYDEKDYSEYYDYPIEDYVDDDNIIGNYPKPVRKAVKKTQKRVHQAMEAFIHNMNQIHSRGGNQVVFSSINYGTDISPEGRCIIRETLKSTYRGVGNGETPIFPIQIWKMKSGVNYEETDKNYDLFKLACRVSARRFFPNFVNLDAPFNYHEKWNINDPERYKYEVATMGR